MRICVVGAGAIGGLLGVKLALSGHELTLVARGAHLEAIRSRGLRLEMGDGSVHFINETIDCQLYNELGTKSGGEVAQLP